MTRQKVIYTLIGITWGAVSLCPAQSRVTDGKPVSDMDDHTMQEKYHIAPTMEAWMGALQHADPTVRTFAAWRLAESGYTAAVPSILAAIATDPVPGDRISFAAAAAKLGAEGGVAALEGMCRDPNWSPGLRMSAAETMLMAGGEGCLGEVIEVLRSRKDDQATVQALYMITRFHHATPAQVTETRAALAACLGSESPGVRTGASYALRQAGATWAVELLRTAVEAERDDSVRRILATDLAHIEGK
jgi:HEAT repeat protein